MSHPAARSNVPDLIFDDICDARLNEIEHLLEAPERVSERDALHRVTVFLTYRCNLDCPYCKTIARSEAELAARPQKRLTYSINDFHRLLDGLDAPVRHLHFTGGEALLLPELAEMVREARRRGAGCLSVTSNGTLPPERYLALVEAGLDEIRISIDAAGPELGRVLTGRASAWAATLRTIRALAAARRGGAKFFLILNAVASGLNVRELPRLAEFLIGLGPDDIKLITSVDERGRLAAPDEAAGLVAQLEALLAPWPESRFPLLRRKIHTVLAPDAAGFEGFATHRDFRCYIPLTERTADGRFYYPCSVYLREGGAPLGRIDEPPDEQRRKSAAFVRRADCLSDPICRRYCLHCTRQYNAAAHRRRHIFQGEDAHGVSYESPAYGCEALASGVEAAPPAR